jgi:hypothetical protein
LFAYEIIFNDLSPPLTYLNGKKISIKISKSIF